MSVKQQTGLPVIHVAAGIIWQETSILVAKRPAGEPKGGYWEFPGGKQEPGEPIEETLKRELLEELGIISTQIVPFTILEHKYPDMHVCLHLMHVTEFTGEPKPLLGQELCWTYADDLEKFDFLPADRPILTKIKKPV